MVQGNTDSQVRRKLWWVRRLRSKNIRFVLCHDHGLPLRSAEESGLHEGQQEDREHPIPGQTVLFQVAALPRSGYSKKLGEVNELLQAVTIQQELSSVHLRRKN